MSLFEGRRIGFRAQKTRDRAEVMQARKPEGHGPEARQLPTSQSRATTEFERHPFIDSQHNMHKDGQ